MKKDRDNNVFFISDKNKIIASFDKSHFENNNHKVLIINNRDYNVASKTLGTPPFRIMIKNLLPYI